jgi:hypothetical protein
MNDLLFGLAIIGGYFLPAFIASYRKHKNATPIFLVNLLFGWSIVGWIWPLIWSTSSHTKAG